MALPEYSAIQMYLLLLLLAYNSESELDSDSKLDPDCPWREVQDIPSSSSGKWLEIHNLLQMTFPFQYTSSPDLTDNDDRDRLWGDWVGCVSPHGPDTQ